MAFIHYRNLFKRIWLLLAVILFVSCTPISAHSETCLFLNQVIARFVELYRSQRPIIRNLIQRFDNGEAPNLENATHRTAFEILSERYRNSGDFQSLIWLKRKAGQRVEAEALQRELIEALSHSPIKSITKRQASTEVWSDIMAGRMVEGNSGNTWNVEYENGMRGIFKPFADLNNRYRRMNTDSRHEISAFDIDQVYEYDVTPTTVERALLLSNGQNAVSGSIQFIVPNVETASRRGRIARRDWGQEVIVDVPERSPTIRCLDVVLGFSDRNPGNYLMRVHSVFQMAIDHSTRIFEWSTFEVEEEMRKMQSHPAEFAPSQRSIELMRTVSQAELAQRVRYVSDEDLRSIVAVAQRSARTLSQIQNP